MLDTESQNGNSGEHPLPGKSWELSPAVRHAEVTRHVTAGPTRSLSVYLDGAGECKNLGYGDIGLTAWRCSNAMKVWIGWTVILLGLASLAWAQVCTPPPSGMVSWWPGDGNANDIVSGNNGVLVGGVTFGQGKVGQAFILDGVTGYINAGISSAFNVADFTLDAWVFVDPATNTGERRVISRDDIFVVAAANRQGYTLKSSSPDACAGASGRAAFGTVQGSVVRAVCAPSTLTPGFHFLTGLRSGTIISLYVDGVLAQTATTSITGILSPFAPLVIGQVSPGFNDEFFAGVIDEVEVFNRALSSAEIAGIYTAVLSLPGGVVGYGIFRQSVTGRSDQEAVAPLSGASSTTSTLIWDDTNFTTAVAIVNPSSLTTTVTIVVRDESGATIGTSALSLAAKSKTAVVLRDLPGLGAVAGSEAPPISQWPSETSQF